MVTGEQLPQLTAKDFKGKVDPDWCPGCGDFGVLTGLQRAVAELGLQPHELMTISGIGCSSNFPGFFNCFGMHTLHGRSPPHATGAKLANHEMTVVVTGGDGDGYGIGGNHFTHTARKNVHLTYVVMDNYVYGLTKKQTSPTSPIGFKSKTDMWGAVDKPINPIKQTIGAGATFVARTTHTNPKHLLEMMDAAMDHDGFSFIECLSECTEFFAGAFDSSNPRKGGEFKLMPEDHDPTDEAAAYALASEDFPGRFGIFYQIQRPTKNALEAGVIDAAQSKFKGKPDSDVLQATFNRMK